MYTGKSTPAGYKIVCHISQSVLKVVLCLVLSEPALRASLIPLQGLCLSHTSEAWPSPPDSGNHVAPSHPRTLSVTPSLVAPGGGGVTLGLGGSE